MEDDSLQNQRLESAKFPVKGMESVIATVSGYHGVERFNLIRLISQTGASYVGNMNQSVTHLVCRKFEGRKYELAKKYKITIVNHRWIEECVKKGRRVSEEPYTFQSGEETGPLLDTPLGIHQAKAQSKALQKSKRPVIDIEREDINNAAWTNSILLDENLFPQQRQNNHCSSRSTRRAMKINSMKDCPGSSGHFLGNPSGPTIIEIEEASTSKLAHSRTLKKRSSTSSEPQCKGRRLVKKHTGMTNIKDLPQNNRCEILSDNSDIETHQRTSTRHASDFTSFLSGQDNRDALDDVDEIENFEHVNDEIQNASTHGAASEDLLEASIDLTDVDPGNKQPAPSEMSCVICWTDFSSTRGVLPCGHRFCFSCIQNWADHMASTRKASTCPLCKASFICITKVEDAVSSDQKIYSQSIPHDSSKNNLYILPDETCPPFNAPFNPYTTVCCQCYSREPEDLLVKCQFCQIRCVHSFCLDPPLFPWTCVQCKDLRLLYLHSR